MGKAHRSQPYTRNYRQLRGEGRAAAKGTQLAIHIIISENIHTADNIHTEQVKN